MNFGVFCPCTHEDFAGFIENDWINCFLFDTIIKEWDHREIFTRIKEKNKTFFLGFYNDLFEREPQPIVDVGETAEIARSYLKPDWKEKIMWYRELFDSDAGQRFYDAFEGFYVDEPFLCGISGHDFYTVTRKLAENFSGKRIFSCFSVGGVAPEVWTAQGCDELTPESAAYLTDVAFDMYHPFDGRYAYITDCMKKRLGTREDYRIWQIPCIMNYRGDKTEKHCLDHLHGLYDLLMKEPTEKRGGLMWYAWGGSESETAQLGNIGFSRLQGRHPGDSDWQTLKAEIERIGKECVSASPESAAKRRK